MASNAGTRIVLINQNPGHYNLHTEDKGWTDEHRLFILLCSVNGIFTSAGKVF